MGAVNCRFVGPMRAPQFLPKLVEKGVNELDQWGLYILLLRFPRLTVAYLGKASGAKYKNTIRDRVQRHITKYQRLEYAIYLENPGKFNRTGTSTWKELKEDPTFLYMPGKSDSSFSPETRRRLQAAAEQQVQQLELYVCRFPDEDGTGISDLNCRLDVNVKDAIATAEKHFIDVLFELEKSVPHFVSDNSSRGSHKVDFAVDTETFSSWLIGLVNSPKSQGKN